MSEFYLDKRQQQYGTFGLPNMFEHEPIYSVSFFQTGVNVIFQIFTIMTFSLPLRVRHIPPTLLFSLLILLTTLNILQMREDFDPQITFSTVHSFFWGLSKVQELQFK